MANIQRIARHLLMTQWRLRRTFPQAALHAIEQAISTSEASHIGQLCFVVEGALSWAGLRKGLSARDRAIEVFSQQRVWDTEHNNGVLIYLLLADRDVEIVADRGIHVRVGSQEWETVCREMEASLQQGQYQHGVIAGVEAISRHLRQHFPAPGNGKNELSNKPVVL
ncbi:TPM domain-containing protein [Cupriavidus sp. a3]|uniref:TPM domain-containing protein n=1 Tax=Cupriavidus sp. a3 TaxID=3242158 RepID=UPI003D9BFFA6